MGSFPIRPCARTHRQPFHPTPSHIRTFGARARCQVATRSKWSCSVLAINLARSRLSGKDGGFLLCTEFGLIWLNFCPSITATKLVGAITMACDAMAYPSWVLQLAAQGRADSGHLHGRAGHLRVPLTLSATGVGAGWSRLDEPGSSDVNPTNLPKMNAQTWTLSVSPMVLQGWSIGLQDERL
jgi:hypothetical protein